MEEEQQKKPVNGTTNVSLPSAEEDSETVVLDNSQSLSNSLKVETNPDFDTELSNSPEKQKKTEEITSTLSHNTLGSQVPNNPTHIDNHDILFNENNVDYCSFSTTTNKKPSEVTSTSNTNKPKSIQSNPVQKILNQVTVVKSDPDSEDDEEKKKIFAAKKLLFPNAVATSFSEVVDTLRDERRQEFCPIYKDETPEEIVLRQAKRKPIGSLLAKRIRWDDLKRKREDDERKARVPLRYGPYGPIYTNQQQSFTNPYEQYHTQMQNQSQQSFANPYEQYYATIQNQYEQMAQMARAQQEHNGFWPGYHQQLLLQNNNQLAQNSMQQQSQPYTYPYPAMYSNNMPKIDTTIPSSYTSNDYNLFLNSIMQPPPPPPDEPYPY